MRRKQNELLALLKEAASRVSGKIAYSIIDTSNGLSYQSCSEEIFRSASLIKIPILLAYLEQVQKGILKPTEAITLTAEMIVPGTGVLKERRVGAKVILDEIAQLMITESDNVATNILIDLFGFELINESILKRELYSTQLKRKMQDFEAITRGLENTTCASDMAKLLLQITKARHQSSIEFSAFEILSAQKLNEKLPKFLPPDVKCAHKTGDFTKLEHDAGILIDKTNEVVVVVLTDDLSDNSHGVKLCQEVGRLVMEYLL
jgi:beta-lactamase class A